MKLSLIIPAAGNGQRMQVQCPKQYLKIEKKSILAHTVTRFLPMLAIEQIIIAISADDTYIKTANIPIDPRIEYVIGGQTRMHSVENALKKVSFPWVMIHDAVRPCVIHDDVYALIEKAAEYDGAILGIPCRDSLKKTHQEIIETTVPREHIWQALTPQLFQTKHLMQAYSIARKQKITVIDDAQAIELLNLKIAMLKGRADNIKITFPEDLPLATLILDMQKR